MPLALVLYFTWPLFSLAQETSKITKISKDRKIREIYYVLDADGKTPHGEYKMFEMFGMQNELLIEGNFSKGAKVGLWTEYFRGGKKIKKSFGKYENNTRVGTWEFRNQAGETEQIIDFATLEVVYFKWVGNEKELKFKVIQEGDTIRTNLDRPPLFLGGTGVLAELIKRKMAYPEKAWPMGKSGLVHVAIVINKEGVASGHRVLKLMGDGLDEEALTVVKELPHNWLPALVNGQPATVEYYVPVKFEFGKDNILLPDWKF